MKKFFQLSFFLIPCTFASHAQNIVQLSFYSPLVSTFEGRYTNNHLVIAQNGLIIFDVSNPYAKPKLVSQTAYPGSYAYQLTVQGNYAYMAKGGSGIFAVYDISNFNAPVLAGSIAIPSTAFWLGGDLQAYGNHVYMSRFDSLYIVDVSNASSPKLANVITVAHTAFTGAEGIAIDHNTLYLRTPFTTEIYDIANRTNPVLLFSLPYKHGFGRAIAADTIHRRIFVPGAFSGYAGYDAYDVSNPSSPKFLFSDSANLSGGDVCDYSYFNDIVYLNAYGSILAFDASPLTHGFVSSFSGQDVPNATVSIDTRDTVFFNIRGGGIEVLNFTRFIPPVCNSPLTLRSNVTGTTATLCWNKVQGAKGYVVRYRQVNRRWKYIKSKSTTEIVRNLLPNTLHYWEVASVCDVADKFYSDFSLTERFTTESAQGLISVTPNPVKDFLKINIKDASAKQIIISNYAGSIVMRLQDVKDGQTISFSRMQPGTYVLQLLNAENEIMGSIKIFKE